MRRLLIDVLFWLLLPPARRLRTISVIFGARNRNEERMRRHEEVLARIWREKDFMDYLYYLSESDKEKLAHGTDDFRRGARLRTLFIAYSANKAHLRTVARRVKHQREKEVFVAEERALDRAGEKIGVDSAS